MQKTGLLLLVLFAASLRATPVHAQTCLGLPSFNSSSVHINVGAEFPDQAKTYAAALAVGRSIGPFINAGGGVITYDGVDTRSTLGFVELGFQIPALLAHICPVAGGFLARGPNDDLFGFEQSTQGGSAGLALGVPLGMPGLRFVPNVAVKYDYGSTKVTETGIGSETYTAQGGTVDVGVAFVLAGRLSVQPLAHFPFARKYNYDVEVAEKTTFGLFAAVALF